MKPRKKIFASFLALMLVVSFVPLAGAQENLEQSQDAETDVQILEEENSTTDAALPSSDSDSGALEDSEGSESESKEDQVTDEIDFETQAYEAPIFSLMNTNEADAAGVDLEGDFIVTSQSGEPLYGGNDIAQAMQIIAASGESQFKLVVQASTTLNQTLSIPAGKSVLVTSGKEGASTLTASGAGQRHFNVAGTLELENIVLDGATIGGGIEFSGSNLILRTGAIIENCYTENHGGGIFAAQGSSVVLQSGSIVRNNVASANVDNLAGSDYGRGGGIYSRAESLLVESGAEVSGNTALYGGGMYAVSSVVIAGSVLDNSAYRSGGGMYCVQSGAQGISLNGATISGNRAYCYGASLESGTPPSTAAGGGGIYIGLGISTKTISVSGATITNNHALTEADPSINNGAGYYTVQRPTGGGIWFDDSNGNTAKLIVENSTISDNSASNGGGASLRCFAEFTNTVFANNHVASKTYNDIFTQGGAIFLNAARKGLGDTYTVTLSGGSVSGCSSSYSAAGIGFTNGNEKQLYADGTAFYDNSIGRYGYAWDIDNPTGFEGPYVDQYKNQIHNVEQITEPYTNIYNNVDVGFGLLRLVSYDANGGLFNHEEVNTEFKTTQFKEDFASFGLRYSPGGKLGSLKSEPYKEDDEFLGWYLADFTTQVEPETRVLENYVFYALWKSQMRMVSYDANTDEVVSDMPESTQVVQGNECSISDSIPKRDHYTFLGWNTQADGNGDLYTAQESFVVDEHVTLYAQWERQIATITYHPSTEYNVLNMPVGTEVAQGETYTVSSLIPELEGFEFLGWNTEEDLTGTTYLPGVSFVVSGHTTLYAEWEIESRLGEFSVWYHPNGATSGTAPVDAHGYDQGETATILGADDLVFTGKVFAGWNTNEDGTGTAYVEGDSVAITETLTLYAQWEDDPLGDRSGSGDPSGDDQTPGGDKVPKDNTVAGSGQGTTGSNDNQGQFWSTSGKGIGLPKTGDQAIALALAGTIAVALLVLVTILVRRSRKKD